MSTATSFPTLPWMMTPQQAQRAWQDWFERSSRLPRAMEIARRVRVGVTPAEAVHQIDKVRLLNYCADGELQYQTPLIVVFALVNRPYILDLREGKSVVAHFVNGGFDVYNVDWGVPTSGDRHLTLEDYVEKYLGGVVDHVRERTGSEQVSLLGYCMGGSLSAMYTALHPEKVKNLIMLAAPVDWSNQDHLLGRWLDPRYFDVDKLIDVCGNAPAEMLQGAFQLLKPIPNFVEKYVTFFEKIGDDKFLEDFFAMETWLNDNIPVAGETFRRFVKECMQENRLIEGRMRLGGHPVDLKRITCPVLNLTAEHDHLVPCGQSLPLNEAISSEDKSAVTFPAGHIGLAVGSKANRELWPSVRSWLAERSEPA